MTRAQIIIRILIVALVVMAGWKFLGKAVGISLLIIAIAFLWFALSFSLGGKSGWQTLFGTRSQGPVKSGN